MHAAGPVDPQAQPPRGLGLAALLDAHGWFGFGAFDIATSGQSLVAQDPQGFDLGTLPGALAVFQDLKVPGAWHAVFIDHFFFFRLWAPEHQQFADVLNWCRVELVGQGLKHGVACRAVIGENAYFDEPMGVERSVNFFFDVGSQTISTDHDDGIKVVGEGAMVFALGGSELDLGHVGIISPARRFRAFISQRDVAPRGPIPQAAGLLAF